MTGEIAFLSYRTVDLVDQVLLILHFFPLALALEEKERVAISALFSFALLRSGDHVRYACVYVVFEKTTRMEPGFSCLGLRLVT